MTADEAAKPSRFLLLDDVADELSTSKAQVYALVRQKRLPAIKIGGRGQWRVETREARGVHRPGVRGHVAMD